MNLLLIKYQKPSYNPWEIFKPSKAFIKECIKDLNQQSYEYLKISRIQDELTQMYFRANLQAEKDKIDRRVRDYQFRLKEHGEMGQHGSEITDRHILQAKERSILDFYNGKTRKAGKDSTGLCEFHNDKHASFTIYKNGTRFKCFSCGAEGDTIDYIKRLHSLTFIGAVKFILQMQ